MGRTDKEKGKGERLLVFETVLYTMPGVNMSVRCVACGLAASAKEERCQGGPSLCSVPLQLLLHTYLLLTPTGALVITHGGPGLSARPTFNTSGQVWVATLITLLLTLARVDIHWKLEFEFVLLKSPSAKFAPAIAPVSKRRGNPNVEAALLKWDVDSVPARMDDFQPKRDKDKESQYISFAGKSYRTKISALYSEKVLDRGRPALV
ncbi:hypothetical protein B0H14DRAFT_2634797 [Mycena olivaceomarginata]|nr:hypothetical protein B0H14DRAFT_2634797 [Mycena olivaceomarginata]